MKIIKSMKTSEKIGIIVVAVLAIILISMLLINNKNKVVTGEDFCDKLCFQRGPENWFFIGISANENSDNSFTTKDECVSACLSENF